MMSGRESLDSIRVQAIPTGINCCSWSEDGDLALGSSEYVHIFTPKNTSAAEESTDPLTGYRQWHSTRIKVNTFTVDEWPELKPHPFSSFSIGEEQSSSTVTSIAWSPPGIAIHRRSLLAVLTTNLVLALWEGTGELGKWERVSLLHHALEKYWEKSVNDKDTLRRKKRVRSFCWGPPLLASNKLNSATSPSGTTVSEKWGRFYLAVANDDHDVLVLHVERIAANEGRSSNLDVRVIADLHLSNSARVFPEGTLEPNSLFADFIASSGIVMELAWSPWINGDAVANGDITKTYSLIAAKHGSQLIILEIICQPKARSLHTDLAAPFHFAIERKELRVQSPFISIESLAWQPLVGFDISNANSNILLLSIVNLGTPVLLRIRDIGQSTSWRPVSTLDISIKDRLGQHRIPNCYFTSWNECHKPRFGFGSRSANSPQLELNVANNIGESLASTTNSIRDWYGPKPITFSEPSWLSEIDDIVRTFQAKYELEDVAAPRIHGLTTNGPQTAICLSVHPMDMLEYTTPSMEVSRIVFSDISSTSDTMDLDQASDEHVFNSDPPKSRLFIRQWILSHLDESDLNSASRINRQLVAVQQKLTPAASWNEELLTEYRTFLETMGLPSKVSPSDIKTSTLFYNDDNDDTNELCTICNTTLDTESAEGTICETGHIYGRCNLSLLAIQQPGISKRCSGCKRHFLDLEKWNPTSASASQVPDSEDKEAAAAAAADDNAKANGHNHESTATAAADTVPNGGDDVVKAPPPSIQKPSSSLRRLFEAFDFCPYCGGKFFG